MANSSIGKIILPSLQCESDPHVEALERRLEMMDRKMNEMNKVRKGKEGHGSRLIIGEEERRSECIR